MAGDMKLGTRVSYNASQDRVPEDNPVNRYQDYTLWDVYLAWEPAMGTFEGCGSTLPLKTLAMKNTSKPGKP